MKLRDWLKANKRTQAWFAKKMGTDQGYVSRLVNGKHVPDLATAMKVEQITSKKVGISDWRKR